MKNKEVILNKLLKN